MRKKSRNSNNVQKIMFLFSIRGHAYLYPMLFRTIEKNTPTSYDIHVRVIYTVIHLIWEIPALACIMIFPSSQFTSIYNLCLT